ncbi:ABC transporter substrate-binding protein [Lacticaseibacillus nasuensis]|uniref:ABC transporter substrate-binding protein n=1 Tax=Lacticaseibacillus nasuensis TaxID=944671 RepID=UPI002246A9BD|nr:ABC transporter substrate-binding protein [Lacticaseibacillus nasuensis]MCX2455485.1 ABC transporter substrate-binding protein [Lacticaseibacillus nasuensis]
MKKQWMIAVTLVAGLALAGCGAKKSSAKPLKNITVVLDYVPNTNHTGMYVAQAKNYYKQAGLKVKFIEPGDNSTSIGLVAAGKGQFGVSYQEDVTYAHAKATPIPVKAIATLVQHNTSSFVTRADSGITSPKQFENHIYAGWQSPSEAAVLKAVMTQAGGDFKKLKIVGANGSGPEGLGKKGQDIEWYFDGWDGIKAKQLGVKLNTMPLRKLDKRLDYYTPVLITSNREIKQDPKTVRAFVKATKQGYQYAIAHPTASAKILKRADKTDSLKFLTASQQYLSKHYTDTPSNWGAMTSKVWNNYTGFMKEYGLIKQAIPAKDMYTNEFLK